MANGDAWDIGAQQGSNAINQLRQRQFTMAEQQRQTNLANLTSALNSIDSSDPDAVTKRSQILQQMGSLYQPHEAEGFLQHLKNLAGRVTGRTPQAAPAPQAPDATTTALATTMKSPTDIALARDKAQRTQDFQVENQQAQDKLALLERLSAGKDPMERRLIASALKIQLPISMTKQQYWRTNPETGAREYDWFVPEYKPENEGWEAVPRAGAGSMMGYKYDPTANQVINNATKERYSQTDPNLPPEVAKIFAGAQQARGLKNRDDRFLAIQQKAAAGQPLTPDEQSYANAYKGYIKLRYVDPRVDYALANQAARFMPFIDPTDPTKNIMVPVGIGSKMGLATPSSVQQKVMTGVLKAFTSGAPATNLTSLRTLRGHLQLFRDATDALQNGDNTVFNNLAQKWAQVSGQPAPADFNAMKTAVTAELGRALKGTGATDQEIKSIAEPLSIADSPEQFSAALDAFDGQMLQREVSLYQQFQGAQAGQPVFSPEAVAAAGGTTATPNTKGPAPKSNTGQKPQSLADRLREAKGAQVNH